MLSAQGNLEGARRAFKQSLEIAQRLAAREPKHTGWQTDLVVSQFKIASMLASGPEPERAQAMALLTQAQGTLRRLAADSRLTHAQQHQWLPAIESLLRQLKNEDPR